MTHPPSSPGGSGGGGQQTGPGRTDRLMAHLDATFDRVFARLVRAIAHRRGAGVAR